MGIDVDRAHRVAFALGTGITAIAGGLLATNYPFILCRVEYVIVMYAGVVLAAWAASSALSGRHDDRPGAADVDLVLPTQLQNAAIFVVFLLIIFFRPQGFFGEWSRGPDDARTAFAAPGYRLHLAVCGAVAQRQQFILSAGADAGSGLGVFGLSWNLLSGYTGLISFVMRPSSASAPMRPRLARSTSICRMDPDSDRRVSRCCRTADRFPTFRLQGHYFALAMLAYPLAILYVFEWLGFQKSRCRSSATIRLPICNSATPHLYRCWHWR